MDTNRTGRPYVLISSDGHAGADLLDYKPYLARELHADLLFHPVVAVFDQIGDELLDDDAQVCPVACAEALIHGKPARRRDGVNDSRGPGEIGSQFYSL